MQRPAVLRFLGDRALDLVGLDSSVRRVIAAAYAVLLGLALATGLRGFLASGGGYIAQPGILLPKAIAWIAAGGTFVAVTFLLSGFAHAKTAWRYIALAPVLLSGTLWYWAAPNGYVNGQFTGHLGLMWAPIAFAAAMTAMVIFGPRFRTRYLLAGIATLFLGYATLAVVLSARFWPSYAPSILFVIVALGSMLLIPALLVVGFDFAEIAVDGAHSLASLVGNRPPWARRLFRIALAAAAVATAVVLHAAAGQPAAIIAAWVLALVLGLTAQLALTQRVSFRGSHGHLRYQHVFYVACTILIAGTVASIWFQEPDKAYFNYDKGRDFSMIVPPGFTERKEERRPPTLPPAQQDLQYLVDAHADMRLMFWSNTKPFHNVIVLAIEHQQYRLPADPPKTMNELVDGATLTPPLHPQFERVAGDSWQKAVVGAKTRTGKTLRFVMYKRAVYGQMPNTDVDWYLICGGAAQQFSQTDELCRRVKHTFHSSHLQMIPSLFVAIVLDLALFAGAAAALGFAAMRSSRSPGPVSIFCYWAFFVAALLGAGSCVLGLQQAIVNSLELTTDLYVAVLIAAALRALAFEVLSGDAMSGIDIRHLRAVAARTNMTLALLGLVLYLYDIVASFSGQSQAIRALVVCLALTWELMTAGRTINESARHGFPRASQILIFVGYLVFVATAVFMFGGLDMVYADFTLGPIDTEDYVTSGIVLLGAAYVLSREPRLLAHFHRPDQQREPAAVPAGSNL